MRSASVLIAVLLMTACAGVSDFDVPPVKEPKPEISRQQTTPTPVNLATRRGPVNDEQAAIAIALAVWIPVYGRELIESEKPYSATLTNGVWTVTGYLPENTVGGTAIAWIAQKDGRVIRYIHEE